MKVNLKIPQIADLQNAYENLSWVSPEKVNSINPESLALWSQWARFDARLGEILIVFLSRYFEKLNPLVLRAALNKQPWPQALLVLCEFTQQKLKEQKDPRAGLFESWFSCLSYDIPPVPFQGFYLGTFFTHPLRTQSGIHRSLKPYLRWGFWSQENLSKTRGHTQVPKKFRLQVLSELLSSLGKIKVKDYIQALGGEIHIRQAERDLADFPNIKSKGLTRKRIYYL